MDGNLTMKKNKLSITHATAKIGGTCHGILSGHLRHSFPLCAHGLTFCVIPACVSFSNAWSIVRWHSGRWAYVFWKCSGLLRPVQLAVEWWGDPHPNTSLFPWLKTRCPHVWSVYAWKIDEKTTLPPSPCLLLSLPLASSGTVCLWGHALEDGGGIRAFEDVDVCEH